MFKDIYKVCDVPPIEIKNGIKGVTKLLTKGTDEKIVDFTSFKEMLECLQEGEDSDFESFDHLEIWDFGETLMTKMNGMMTIGLMRMIGKIARKLEIVKPRPCSIKN